MNDGYSYSPTTAAIALGDKVKWTNNAVVSKHDVNTSTPHGLFSSGGAGSLHTGGDTYSYRFTSAGTFAYFCIFHASDDMRGTVVVPMKVSRVTGSPERFKITVGSVALASSVPWVRVVQVDLPHGGTHYSVIKTTRVAFFKYTPSAHGTYRFRSYLKSTGTAGQSQTSPVVSISH